ncbi:plastocyanin/azurin family copper-binding protein [Haloarchaeobius sp. TZWWS8]|uniref:plastocyanin/azurin family copper-binding protein n=1 Tax=Haloarchaeobius sp. TZWWS8 TaxID=3446121 RepID=UPI003EBCB18B
MAASGVAGGAAAASAAAPAAASQEEETTTSGTSGGSTTGTGTGTGNGTGTGTGNSTGTSGGGGGGGGSETVVVGPSGNYVFTPGTDKPLYIKPGTTVTFNWESDNHNVNPTSVPEGAKWEGHKPVENTGFSFSSTFDTKGTYEYQCDPHAGLGMKGTIIVNDAGAAPSGGGGEVDPEHMGVPFQAHWVGIATILAIISSLMFTFYVLKYGESANTSSPGRK